jgi:hypothetical protein
MAHTEFIPNGRAIWQSNTAKSYPCPYCSRWIFTQYEGTAPLLDVNVRCETEGHTVTWDEPSLTKLP